MHWTRAALATLTTLALGCGGTVITPSQSSNTTSGDGGASATATSTGGTGGAGGSFAVSSSTGAPPPACNDATVFVDIVGDGANQHHDASCAPEGHVLQPGGAKTPYGGGTLTITTCPLATNQVLVLSAAQMSWPATAESPTIYYYHDGAEYDSTAAFGGQLEVFTFEAVGGVIEGAFTATVVPKDPAGTPSKIQITGKFRVCRGPDFVPV